MKFRRLGTTGLSVSEIGLGCQSLGGGIFHGSRRDARELVAHALDSGITFFDTSDHYSLGQSEQILGEVLPPVRDRVVLSTKLGTLYSPTAKMLLAARPAARAFKRFLKPMKHRLDYYRSTQRRADFSLRYLRRALGASLRRLRTDRIDLLMLHKPPASDLGSGQVGEVIGELRALDEVGHVGVSCETVDDALACLSIHGVSAVQVTVNLIDQLATERLLRDAETAGIGVIARNPRAAGLLTSGYGDVTAETYARDRDAFDTSRAYAKRFDFLADDHRSLSQAAIRYVLQLPGVSVTTPRPGSVQEIDDAVAAAALPDLSDAHLERIRQTAVAFEKEVRKYAYRSSPSPSVR